LNVYILNRKKFKPTHHSQEAPPTLWKVTVPLQEWRISQRAGELIVHGGGRGENSIGEVLEVERSKGQAAFPLTSQF
jgi:hypothetical protein